MNATLSRHVLVVDDEPGFRDLLTRILTRVGYEVRTAADAHGALQSIADLRPAVAICDVHMPGPNGLWLADQIRAASPTTAIILATSDAGIPPTETLREGIIAYIVKPLDRRALLAAVGDAFRAFAANSGMEIPRVVVFPAPETDPQPFAQTDAPSGVSWRWLPVVPLLTAIALGAYWVWLQQQPGRVVSHVADSSGVVVVEDASGNTLRQGSGFFVAPDVFVTNHHVVTGGAAAQVMTNQGVVVPVRGLLANDWAHDLVLLQSSGVSSPYLSLVTSPPAIGDDIWVFGAPLGLQGTLSKGIVSAERTERQPMLQISAPISAGSSGSPVVNTRGDVVGVAAAVGVDGQNLNFAVPALYVRQLLDGARALRPLIAAARGAANDLERDELIGPVRMVTAFGHSPLVRIFDRQGRLIEQTLGDGMTRTQYQYDADGHLTAAVDRVSDTTVSEWNFVPVGRTVFEARHGDSHSGSVRRLEYSNDGRLISDETRTAGRVLQLSRWTYDSVGWPTTDATPDSAPEAAAHPQEEHDAIGNVTRRVNSDGTEIRFEYVFDRNANWISREAFRVDAHGVRTVVSSQRRDIQYW
jgi:YD repeat-containing protein